MRAAWSGSGCATSRAPSLLSPQRWSSTLNIRSSSDWTTGLRLMPVIVPCGAGTSVQPVEDLVEQLQRDAARDARELVAADAAVEALVAARLAACLALAGRDELACAREDRAQLVGVGEPRQVAGAARDGVVEDDEAVAVVGVAAGRREVRLDDAQVRRDRRRTSRAARASARP